MAFSVSVGLKAPLMPFCFQNIIYETMFIRNICENNIYDVKCQSLQK